MQQDDLRCNKITKLFIQNIISHMCSTECYEWTFFNEFYYLFPASLFDWIT